jgi:hypothetical protein
MTSPGARARDAQLRLAYLSADAKRAETATSSVQSPPARRSGMPGAASSAPATGLAGRHRRNRFRAAVAPRWHRTAPPSAVPVASPTSTRGGTAGNGIGV